MNTIKFPSPPKLTKDAAARWNRIPSDIRKAILNAVWCGACCDGVPAELISGKMKKGDLLLECRCKQCGNAIARLIEPEAP